MKTKFTAKKQILLFIISILIIVAAPVILIQTRRVNIQNQEEKIATDQNDKTLNNQNSVTNTPKKETEDNSKSNGTRNIYIYSVDRTLRDILNKYAKEHWDFPYNINFYADDIVYSSTDIINIATDKLVNDPSSLDMYCVPAHADYFIKGELSEYASTFKELGIDVDAALEKADIPQYAIDSGKNPEGEIISLPYLSTVSVFVYRRSVAKEVWGTDDPNDIAGIIGGGTENWDSFKQAAMTLKDHGFYIVPGFKDIYSTGLSSSYGSDGAINPQWEEFMDVSKYLYDNGCIKDTEAWTDQWFKDLDGVGNKILGYVSYTDFYQYMPMENTNGDWAICKSPINIVNDYYTGVLVNKNSPNKDILGPFIEWLAFDSSETGPQYQLATGTFDDQTEKLSVISGTVLNSADSSRDILGGQNINPIVYEALHKAPGMNKLTTDNMNDYYYWEEAIKAYLWGGKDRDTAIREFRTATASGNLPGPEPDQDEVINWKNKNFERAIRTVLKKPASDIYMSDVSQITELYLDAQNLDSIEDIECFKNLTLLYCNDNELSDISSLEKLSKLEVLQLNNNNITDISSLKELRNLKELNMYGNEIEDIRSLTGLTNLKGLHLSANKINDISSLAGLTELEVLEMSENEISNIDSLKDLKLLNNLILFDNKINDISVLKDLTNITEIYLDRNRISDISSLEGLIKLSSLSLSDNEISEIDSLSGLINLNYLLLIDNSIRDIGCLSNLQNLTNLELKGNEIKDISNLTGLNNLIHLDLSSNEISEINNLKGLPKLESLFLADTKLSDISFISEMKSLKSLSLVGNNIKDKSPAKDVLYVSW